MAQICSVGPINPLRQILITHKYGGALNIITGIGPLSHENELDDFGLIVLLFQQNYGAIVYYQDKIRGNPNLSHLQLQEKM